MFLVLNPVSGFFVIPGLMDIHVIRRKFEQHFSKAGWQYEIYETTGKEDVAEVVRAALRQPCDLVVAAGGDGTVSEVATGLQGSDVPLAVLPAGTWNALARNLHIPLVVDDALRLMTGEHQLRLLDAMRVGRRLYLLNISVGVSSGMITTTSRTQKRKLGPVAYFKNVLSQLFGIEVRAFALTVDGVVHKTRASEVMVANSSLIGIGELPTRLNIQPDDGKVEVCSTRARTLLDWLLVAWNILIGHSITAPKLDHWPAEHNFTIDCRTPITVQGDGDAIGKTPINVEVIPRAVRIITPL